MSHQTKLINSITQMSVSLFVTDFEDISEEISFLKANEQGKYIVSIIDSSWTIIECVMKK